MNCIKRGNLRGKLKHAVVAATAVGLIMSTHNAQAFSDEPAAVFFSHDQHAEPQAFQSTSTRPQTSAHRVHATFAMRPERRRFPAENSQVRAMVTASALQHNIPVGLAHGIVRVESGYNCRARSRSGATGIMQTLRSTARGVGVGGSLTNCAQGLEAGMRYLQLAIALHGTGCAAASSFERGVYAPSRCTSYGRKVMALASQG